METIRLRTTIPKSRRVEITIPPEIPEGPVELTVVVTPEAAGAAEAPPASMAEMLARLRRLRERFSHEKASLSDAVIEERRRNG